MPNYVRNLLVIKGEDAEIERFIQSVSTEGGEEMDDYEGTDLDLEKICPMPLELNIGNEPEVPLSTMSGLREKLAKANNDYEITRLNKQIRMIESKEKTGYYCWYDWRVDNWGVKWNIEKSATGWYTETNRATLFFDSASNAPSEAIRKASVAYPELNFTLYSLEAANGWASEENFVQGNHEEVTDSLENMTEVCEIFGLDLEELNA